MWKIKSQFNRLKIAVHDTISPLPDPQTVLNKFWRLPFRNLSGHQLEQIITMVIDEARISRSFGLFIRPEDLDTEILFWLTFVNTVGPERIRQSNWDHIWQLAANARTGNFEKLSQYYFDLISRSKSKITSANTAYDCHLQAVQKRILDCIFDGKLTIT